MIIIPDLFSPYLEDVEAARKANWDDLTKYNTVQKGQLDNLFDLATFSPKVNREYENTNKLALENLFGEENFQNKLLAEMLKNQVLAAQAGYYNRRGLGDYTGVGGLGAAGPGGTANNNPAGSGLPMAGGKTHKTSQTPPGTQQTNTAAASGTPTPGTATGRYRINETGSPIVNDLNPRTVNPTQLNQLRTLNYSKAASTMSPQARALLAEEGFELERDAPTELPEGFGYFDTSNWGNDAWDAVRGLQAGQGVVIGGNLVTMENGMANVMPMDDAGYVDRRYLARIPGIQVQ